MAEINYEIIIDDTKEFVIELDEQGPQGLTGPRGADGADGLAATIHVGNVTTGEPGSDASVTNSGTDSNAVFDFSIPKGEKGDTGEITGATASITNTVGTPSVTVTSGGTSEERTFDFAFENLKGEPGVNGTDGTDGTNATITNVTASVDANVGTPSVTVTMGGTESARTFDFAFSNLKGADGQGSGTVSSVNNISPDGNGNVTLTASDVGAYADNNPSGYITSSALNGYATETWVGQQGYITGISSSDVTTALGYTPYDSSNPSGYTSNVGTVTSVNNEIPDSNGNVELQIPTRNLGEIVTSTIPLTDAGLHLLDGALIQGSGSYSAFVDYIADIYSDTEILYAWGVGAQAVYTKTAEPTVGVTPLYDSDGEKLVGYTITQVSLGYTSIEYSISGDTTLYGRSRAEKEDIYSNKIFTNETQWQLSVTTYGVCGKFVYDSVNNTVRLPKVTGFTEGTLDIETLGDLTEAGLPSIEHTHEYWIYSYAKTGASGTARNIVSGSTYPTPSTNSAVSPIYGRSSTVQPQSIKVLYYIVIATSTKTDIEVDIDEIATDLNGKADVDLTNCIGSLSDSSRTYLRGLNSYGELDWSNQITLSTATVSTSIDYVLPDDGCLFVSAYCNGGTNNKQATASISFYYDIENNNAQNLSYGGVQQAGSYVVHSSCAFGLKGQKFNLYTLATGATTNTASMIFVPLKKS